MVHQSPKGCTLSSGDEPYQSPRKRLVGQAVKTPASHAGNAGSIPARVTRKKRILSMYGDKEPYRVGVDDAEGPPVPMPNTEVKLSSAEDT